MKKISLSLLTLALVLTFGCFNQSMAAGPQDGRAPYGPYGQQLTPEQMEMAKQIFDQNYTSMNATRQALAEKRALLDAELASPAPDKSKIESLSREIGDLRGKMLSARVDVRNQLNKQGLPSDFYAPDVPPRNSWRNGPEVWHHGHGHGHGPRYGCWGPRRGMMGMMDGYWGGWHGGCWGGY